MQQEHSGFVQTLLHLKGGSNDFRVSETVSHPGSRSCRSVTSGEVFSVAEPSLQACVQARQPVQSLLADWHSSAAACLLSACSSDAGTLRRWRTKTNTVLPPDVHCDHLPLRKPSCLRYPISKWKATCLGSWCGYVE